MIESQEIIYVPILSLGLNRLRFLVRIREHERKIKYEFGILKGIFIENEEKRSLNGCDRMMSRGNKVDQRENGNRS